jgi:YD repeat-containing protein
MLLRCHFDPTDDEQAQKGHDVIMKSKARNCAVYSAFLCLAAPAAKADTFTDLNIPPPSELWGLKSDRLPNGIEIQRSYVRSDQFAVYNGVNVRNGNWSVSYSMIGGAFDITYNSFSGHVGWFGYGWGSPFETRLVKMRDGTIYIQVNGTGAIATFGSGSPPKYASMMGDVIIKEAAKTANGSEEKIQKRLETQKEYAIEMALKYGAVSAPSVNSWKLNKSARDLNGNCDENGFLLEIPAGYIIKCGDNRILFDEDGNLLSGETPSLGEFTIQYLDSKKPISVHGENRSLQFLWGANGILQIVELGKNPDTIEYGPNNRLTLLRQRIAGFTYEFEYNDRADMTAIRYGDGTSKALTYDGASAVTSMTERNGEKTTFQVERHKPVGVYWWDFVSVLTEMPSGSRKLNVYQIALP